MHGIEYHQKLYDSIPGHKKKARAYGLDKVKKDIQDQAAESKRKDLNLNVDYWKNKFLFPFGDIAPIKSKARELPDTDINAAAGSEKGDSFSSIMSKKYFYPLENIEKKEYLEELQRPINVQIEEIVKDLYKFIKDFPQDVIPHMTDEELDNKASNA